MQNVRVDASIYDEKTGKLKTTPFVKGTKTTESTRRVKLPQYICNLILNLPDTETFITQLSGVAIYKRFMRMLKNNGLPHFRIHDLRHANASDMLKLNVPDKYAMERLGHKTQTTLKMVYQHTMIDEALSINDRINNYFSSLIETAHETAHEN